MRATETTGKSVQGQVPSWTSLVDAVGTRTAAEFMWMFEVRLADGTRVDAYKHIENRRYLHLSDDGRAFVYVDDGHYREIDLRCALVGVLPITDADVERCAAEAERGYGRRVRRRAMHGVFGFVDSTTGQLASTTADTDVRCAGG